MGKNSGSDSAVSSFSGAYGDYAIVHDHCKCQRRIRPGRNYVGKIAPAKGNLLSGFSNDSYIQKESLRKRGLLKKSGGSSGIF